MKNLLFVPLILLWGFIVKDYELTEKERKFAVSYLEETKKGVEKAVNGLTDNQLNFKPAPDKWSVKECVQHIAVSEGAIWQGCEAQLKQAANPEKRAEIKVTDDQVIKMISDRSNKVKTTENLQPENSGYATATDALNDFRTKRDKLIQYVKTTKDDMRNHVAQMPFGPIDTYQMVLFIGAHTNRHTLQIEEVKADPNFPKN
jgi:hypothetical protein